MPSSSLRTPGRPSTGSPPTRLIGDPPPPRGGGGDRDCSSLRAAAGVAAGSSGRDMSPTHLASAATLPPNLRRVVTSSSTSVSASMLVSGMSGASTVGNGDSPT